jgi:hypothetical protein
MREIRKRSLTFFKRVSERHAKTHIKCESVRGRGLGQGAVGQAGEVELRTTRELSKVSCGCFNS